MKNTNMTQKIKTGTLRELSALLASVLVSWLTLPTQAAFENIGQGARPEGMGGAFTAVGGDVHALYFNPAALGTIEQPELATMYSRLFMGLSDDSDIGVSLLGYAQPIGSKGRFGSAGVGLWRIKLDSLFTEQYVTLGWGKPISDVLEGKLHLGASLKMLSRSFGSTPETQNAINLSGSSLGRPDPVFANGNSKNGYALDLAAFYRWQQRHNFGFTLQNINEPDMALGVNDSDKVPMTMRLGYSTRFGSLNLAADLERQESIPGLMDNRLHLGAERWWALRGASSFTARFGFIQGNRGLNKLALGMGYQFSRVIFNYGFQLPLSGIRDTQGNHQLSINILFGKLEKQEDLSKLLDQERTERIKAEKRLLEAERQRIAAEEKLKALESQKAASTQGIERLTVEEKQKDAEQEAQAAKAKQQQAQESLQKAYNLSLDYYQRRKNSGSTPNQQIEMLNRIIEQYTGRSIALTQPKQELENIKEMMQKTQKDFAFSWEYYQNLSKQGVSSETRIELLERIIKKFETTNVDLAPVREELKKLVK
ncbi:MAG: type IX secretion system membrane protein PorP/SprF [Elusimicrobiota bacterium]